MTEDILAPTQDRRGEGRIARLWGLLDVAVRKLGGLVLVCAGLCLVGLFALGTIEIVASQFFGRAVPSAFEFQEVLMGMAVFATFAAIQRRRAHIVVDILSQGFGGVARKLSDLLALTAGFIVFALLTWQAGLLALRSVTVLELSPGFVPFPVYPVKLFVSFCALVALLEFARQLVRRVVFWTAEDYDNPGPLQQ